MIKQRHPSTSRATRLDAQPFRIWLCRRLFLPLPLSSRPADVAAYLTCLATIEQRVRGLECWEAGVSHWSVLPHRSAGRQAGAWVLTDMSATWTLGRSKVSMSAESKSSLTGSPCGMKLSLQCLSTTLVSPLHCDGTARRNAATTNGVALQDAHRAKERTHPELTGEGGPVGCAGGRSGRSVVRGNSSLPRSSGESSDARVCTDLARQDHSSSIPQTLERLVGARQRPSQCRCDGGDQSPVQGMPSPCMRC